MTKLPIALQLFSVREELEKDFEGTIRKIKEMGYDGVELAGRYNRTAGEIKDCLIKYGLPAVSAHVPVDELLENTEDTLSYYQEIGCKYIAIPYLTEAHRYGTDQYQEILAGIPKISIAAEDKGMTLLYHNHDFEFARTESGSYVLDELYGMYSEKVLQTELDTCWVSYAGENPVTYIEKYKNRCPLVHLKDYVKEDSFLLKPLGKGIQNMPAIIKKAEECGTKWLVVEQDDHEEDDALTDSDVSLQYLKK